MITIELKNAENRVLAAASHAEEALLCVDRAYLPGDKIIISGGDRLYVRMDQQLPEGEVYAPDGVLTWFVPAGEHRLAYAPGTFEAPRHVVSARLIPPGETEKYRNIARNPADLRGDTDFYPHCTANVETRDEACFAARNVIDGYLFNQGHGEWPWQSWGIGIRQDACCRIDFGREVEASCVALVLRADFPHDAWWQRVRLRLSDGSSYTMSLEKTGERQFMDIGRHVIRWMELDQLEKADDPSPFPSLSQWEVYGCDR